MKYDEFVAEFGHVISHEDLEKIFGMAADLIEKDGWYRGGALDTDHPNYKLGAPNHKQQGVPMCTAAVIEKATSQVCPEFWQTYGNLSYGVAEEYLQQYQSRYRNIPDWNDYSDIDEHGVLDFLRDIEKKERILAEGIPL